MEVDMNEALGITLLVIVGTFSLAALFQAVRVAFGDLVARAADLAVAHHGRAVVLGLVNGLFLFGLAAGLAALGDLTGFGGFGLLAVLLLAMLVAGWVLGLSAMAGLLGERSWPGVEPVRRQLLGGGLLVLACLAPYAGWFLLLPYLSLRGLGGVVMALYRGRKGSGSRVAAAPAAE
jgi:hypothetical protein